MNTASKKTGHLASLRGQNNNIILPLFGAFDDLISNGLFSFLEDVNEHGNFHERKQDRAISNEDRMQIKTKEGESPFQPVSEKGLEARPAKFQKGPLDINTDRVFLFRLGFSGDSMGSIITFPYIDIRR